MLGGYLIRKRGIFILLLFLLAGSGVARGNESPATLETMTVTAERFPVDEKDSPRLVTIVSSAELKETGANNLVDALRRIGGLAYSALAPLGISHGGMNSTLSIRGLPDGELVLINGVPIQGAAGHAYDLNTIAVDQIERVEILKGAASTLYGADAMTGVINIITKKPGDRTTAAASVEFGNESYQNHSASLSLPKATMGLTYQHLGSLDEISRSFTKGYRYDIDATDLYSWNLDANPIKNLFVDYLGSYSSTGFEKHYDSGEACEGTDQSQYKHFLDVRYETRTVNLKAFGTYEQMNREEYTDPDEPEDKNKNYNFGLQGDYRFDVLGAEFTVGGDGIYRGADYNNQYGSHYRTDYALFLQLKRILWERWIVTLGAREQFIDGTSGARDYNRFLPSFGLTFKATDSLNLFANAGKAFRAPTFNNLYYESSFLVGNPNLEPEEGWTYESGAKYDIDWLHLRMSAFYMDFDDKIELDRSQGYPLTYFNAGDYSSMGIEWETRLYPFVRQVSWLGNISLYAAGYWADPTAQDTNGEEYQAGPKFQTSIGLAHTSEPLVLDLNCQVLAGRERDLDSYATLNFYSKYKLWKGHVTFAIDNMTDQEVQISGDLSKDASNNYLYYDTGLLVKIGYQIRF